MRTLAESLLLGAGLLVAPLGCHKVAPIESSDGALTRAAGMGAMPPSEAGAAPVAETESSASTAMAPARCQPAGPGIALGASGGANDLELGDAIEAPPGSAAYAVSLLHRTARGLEAAVGLVSAGIGEAAIGRVGTDAGGGTAKVPTVSAAVIDLGPTLGDAPPPRVLVAGGDLLAAAYSIGDAAPPNANATTRRLSLYQVPAGRAPKAIFEVPQQRDDSLAFDVALVLDHGADRSSPAGKPSALVVWDEASRAGHGVIRAATVSLADRMSAPAPSPAAAASEGSIHDVSPSESDAEVPRVVSFGAGAIAMWIARKPEPGVPTDAAEVEATGEARSFGWLESIALDERGVPAGPVRKLTPASGHVSAYDVRILPAAHRPTLLIVARDDGEAVDASGGELLRVRIVGDAIEPPVAFPSDGLGRGGPALVDGDPAWLVWIGPHEQLRLLPLDAEGAPLGKPSAEDEMSEGRPLLFLPGGGARSKRALVASPFDPEAPLRFFGCTL